MAWVQRGYGPDTEWDWNPSPEDDPNKIWVKREYRDDGEEKVSFQDPITRRSAGFWGPPTGRHISAGDFGNLNSEFWKSELRGTSHWLEAFGKLQQLGGLPLIEQAAKTEAEPETSTQTHSWLQRAEGRGSPRTGTRHAPHTFREIWAK